MAESLPLTLTAETDLTLAAPQIVHCGCEGTDDHRVRPGNTLPVCSPYLRMSQKHDNGLSAVDS